MQKCQILASPLHVFFISIAFFKSASVLHNFSMNWASNVAQLLFHELRFKCCAVHIIIIILRTHFTFSIFMFMLGLDPFMSYLCDFLFIFSLIFIVIIFIVINHINSFKQGYLFFVHFLEYLLLFLDDNVEDEESE